MKRCTLTLVLLAAVAGCGGSSAPPPPFTLTCKTRLLPSGAIRAAVTVKSAGSQPGHAILYGPALRLVTHEYPLLSTRFVVDRHGGSQTTYIGLVVPRVKANGAAHLLLRFTRPTGTRSFYVTNGPHVSGSAAQSGSCTIKGR